MDLEGMAGGLDAIREPFYIRLHHNGLRVRNRKCIRNVIGRSVKFRNVGTKEFATTRWREKVEIEIDESSGPRQ